MSDYTGFEGELTLRGGRKVFVRKATPADAEGLRAFLMGLSERSWHCFHPHGYEPEVITERLARGECGEDWLYLGFDGETVVGYFFLWNIGAPVPVLGIGVADDWQNEGLGHLFMNQLIEDGRRLGKRGIELTCMPDNDRAFHLYQKLGFEYFGKVEYQTASGETEWERGMFLPLVEGATRDN